MAKVNYAEWKIIAWRYLRVFLAACLASLSVDQFIIATPDLRVTLLKSAVAGGLAALAKYLREGKDYSEAITKLPL